jgi:hypothetical protein
MSNSYEDTPHNDERHRIAGLHFEQERPQHLRQNDRQRYTPEHTSGDQPEPFSED